MKQTKKIPRIIKFWEKSIKRKNPDLMTSLYSRNAILLPTFAEIDIGHAQIHAYFTEFLNKDSISCFITNNFTQITNRVIIANGLYTFVTEQDTEKQIVNARYTYVIKNNKIITHHSSILPEK